jgi:hypothetical protein
MADIQDLKITNGDLDFVVGKDLAIISDKVALATLVQTNILGNDKNFQTKLKDIINSTSVRKLSNDVIGSIVREEINLRMKKIPFGLMYIKNVNVNVDKKENEIRISLESIYGENFTTELKFIGKMFDETNIMEFQEVGN